MNAICFGCKAIHRNVPLEVVEVFQENNLTLRCPRCNDEVITFESDEDLFNMRIVIDDITYSLLWMTEDGKEGQLTYVEVTE